MEEKEVLKKLGQRISDLRKQRGLSQVNFAHSINMDRQNLWQIEQGLVNITTLTLYRISNGLQVTIKDLFDF